MERKRKREREKAVEGVRRDDKNTKKKTPLQEQSGLIISTTAFKPFPSKQSDRRLPEEVKAENRGERRKPMTREDKAVGNEEVKREVMRKGWRWEPNAKTEKS